MPRFKIAHLDLTTGRRVCLPWVFQSQEEALERIMDLTIPDPTHSYIVVLSPDVAA